MDRLDCGHEISLALVSDVYCFFFPHRLMLGDTAGGVGVTNPMGSWGGGEVR